MLFAEHLKLLDDVLQLCRLPGKVATHQAQHLGVVGVKVIVDAAPDFAALVHFAEIGLRAAAVLPAILIVMNERVVGGFVREVERFVGSAVEMRGDSCLAALVDALGGFAQHVGCGVPERF